MPYLKTIPQTKINSLKENPLLSGLQYMKFGKHSNFSKYTNDEITEMIYGIYKDKETILVDGDYFVNLKEVIQINCNLESVSYYKKPTRDNYANNAHNSIKNIRTFYVKDYFLVTQNEINDIEKHNISNLLYKIGAIKQGRNNFASLYKVDNNYKTFQTFKQGIFPKDLFHPINQYINELFYQDEYRISDFKVESKVKLEN